MHGDWLLIDDALGSEEFGFWPRSKRTAELFDVDDVYSVSVQFISVLQRAYFYSSYVRSSVDRYETIHVIYMMYTTSLCMEINEITHPKPCI